LNEGADRKANEGTLKNDPTRVNMKREATLNVSRVKLTKLMQKLAYKAIWENKMKTYKTCGRTKMNLERAKACAPDAFGKTPTNANL
jgi:hypothetical protein